LIAGVVHIDNARAAITLDIADLIRSVRQIRVIDSVNRNPNQITQVRSGYHGLYADVLGCTVAKINVPSYTRLRAGSPVRINCQGNFEYQWIRTLSTLSPTAEEDIYNRVSRSMGHDMSKFKFPWLLKQTIQFLVSIGGLFEEIPEADLSSGRVDTAPSVGSTRCP
jgi:hypothetical protein